MITGYMHFSSVVPNSQWSAELTGLLGNLCRLLLQLSIIGNQDAIFHYINLHITQQSNK